jgi:glutamate N-acetyltransferase/amino-acid N-acetyltransferase
VPVPPDYIGAKLPAIAKQLRPDGWADAAKAIMTTDTFPKGAARTARIGDAEVTVAGFAKGSGMIAPDMATMLGFLFTDAKIPAPVLQALLTKAVDDSFNAVTVDGDTSTSDSVLLCATGAGARHPRVTAASDRHLADFKRALQEVAADLAVQIVRDGEGAQKLITIDVTGAASKRAARRIGLAIANSPLVKTAVAGGDPNWGRIVMAVGKSGEAADRDKLSISIGGVPVTENGQLRPDYSEATTAKHMAGDDIRFEVDIGLGRGKARVWTCDLTHGYITINADYRT